MSAVLGDDRLHEFTGGAPLTAEALKRRYQRLLRGPQDPDECWLNWIIRLKRDGAAVGTLQATVARQAKDARIAWVVGLPWQRTGIASEATPAIVDWLWTCGLATISASIHPDHFASQRVAQRLGLRPTGTIFEGEEIWFAARPDYETPPAT